MTPARPARLAAFAVLAFTLPIGATAAPAITQILNNSSGTPPGLPNYGIAPSSIFAVVGTGLADPGVPTLQDTTAPGGLPLTLNGTSITVVVNGVTTHPGLYYTSPTQLAAVLPAATPVGTGTLTVTYNGVISNSAVLQVVASAIGFNHFNQTPVPLGKYNANLDIGVATDNSTGNLLTFTNSGTPLQNIVLWATGLGADSADSDTSYSTSPHAVSTPLQIYFGGVLATILYQGSAGYPGVNQINVTIPASVLTGCYVPLVAVTGTVISNVVMFPVHPGGGPCVEQSQGTQLTGTQILQDTQDTLKGGTLNLGLSSGPNGASVNADAAFEKISGLLAAGTGRAGVISPGGCAVWPTVVGGPLTISGLDTGAITLTGPAALSLTLASQGIKGAFGANLAGTAIPSSGGTFTFKGAGGTDVGSFTSTVTFTNPIITWTNKSTAATVDRTQPLTFAWVGGNPGTYVVLGGSSTVAGVTVAFTCRVAVDPGQFTVPSYILLGMPPGAGSTTIQHLVVSTFSATGLDTTLTTGSIEYRASTTFK
jgi:uncharacterized protein (TIGR03437 family)